MKADPYHQTITIRKWIRSN